VQTSYLKASGDTLGGLPLVAVFANLPSLRQEMPRSVLPVVKLVPHERPPSAYPVLRI
jgi:hypothetical protein